MPVLPPQSVDLDVPESAANRPKNPRHQRKFGDRDHRQVFGDQWDLILVQKVAHKLRIRRADLQIWRLCAVRNVEHVAATKGFGAEVLAPCAVIE